MAIGVLVAAFGAVIALRWIFHIESIARAVPDSVMMGINAPALFIVVGVALVLRAMSHLGKPLDRLASLLALSAIIYPAIIFLQTLLGVNLGLDFVRVPTQPTPDNPHPGRIAPNTAMAFITAGIILWLMRAPFDTRRRRVLLAALILLSVIAVLGLVGYLLGLELLYRLASYNRMLLPTSIGLTVLAAGLWLLRDSLIATAAFNDPLTGLANRRQFNDRLPQALARSQRAHTAIALMFLDVDHFKAINDSLGHAGGDAVLSQFAERLSSSVRITDLVSRIAGDEFVILLESLHDPAEAERVAGKIEDAVRQPMQIQDKISQVTTSIGVAYLPPGVTADPVALLAVADEALYESKQRGRNTRTLKNFSSTGA